MPVSMNFLCQLIQKLRPKRCTDRQTDRQTQTHTHTHDENITSAAYAGGKYLKTHQAVITLYFRTGDLIKASLLDNEFMRHLDITQINEIVECMFEVKCNRDDMIIIEGEVGVRVYVIQGLL